MASLLYVAIVVGLLFVALAVCIPVLFEIVREGRQRREKWKTGELGPPQGNGGSDPGAHQPPEKEETADDEVACHHCGTANSVDYVFCQACARRLQ